VALRREEEVAVAFGGEGREDGSGSGRAGRGSHRGRARAGRELREAERWEGLMAFGKELEGGGCKNTRGGFG
jgi:hypothetical protein